MKIYLKSAILFLLMAAASSCVSDDPVIDPLNADGRTYTDLTGLTLTYNGVPEIGKTVKVVVDGKDRSKGYIVGWSQFDTQLIPGMPEQFAGVIPGPGILPGDPKLILPVTFVTDGGVTRFEGSSRTDHLEFDYSGTLSDNSLILAFTNARLRNQTLAGSAWHLQPPVLDDNPADPIEESPFIVDWEPDDKTSVDIGGMKIPAEDILMQLLNVYPLATVGTENVTVAELVCGAVRRIEFEADGNVSVTSADPADPLKEIVNPVNSIQYVITAQGELLLFINPQQLILGSRSQQDASPLVEVLTVVSRDIVPLLSTGIPFTIKVDATGAEVELGNGLPLKILKGAILPLVSNRTFMEQLVAWLDKLPGADQITPMATPFFGSLPGIIGATTQFGIGMNLVAAK